MKKAGKLSLIMMLVFALLLTACSTNNEGAKEPEVTTPNNTAAGNEEETVTGENQLPDIDLFKFETETPIEFAKSVADINSYPEGEDPENNAVYELMARTMNIVPTNKFSAQFDTYLQKLKLGIASNDIPDIFYADQATTDELIKNDLVWDLKPYYEKYATENAKSILGFDDGLLFKGAQRGYQIYGMPNVSDALNQSPVIYIRKDWMENLNLKKPTTLEELLDMARQFTNNDPDGNDKNDTYGLSMNNELDIAFTAFMNAYGAYPKIYQKDSEGNFVYGTLDPNMKEGLDLFVELYNDKVFDPEFATKNSGKSVELVQEGKVGIYVGQFFSPLWPLGDVLRNVPGSDFEVMPFLGLSGQEFVPFVPINVNGYFVVSKQFEHPEALMIILNNMAETSYSNLENQYAKEWADLSSDPKYSAVGGLNNWLPVFMDRPDANTNRYNQFKYALDNNDESKLLPDQKDLFGQVKAGLEGDADNWAWSKTFMEGVPHASSYETIERNQWFGSPTETGLLKGPSLKKLEDEFLIQVIFGEKSTDDFDSFVTQWNEMGGKQILDEMNASEQ